MLIDLDSGIKATKPIRTQAYRNGTTFQLVTALPSPTPIIIEIPTEPFDYENLDSYSGGWTQLKSNGTALQLDASNNAVTVYGSIVIRLNKSVDEQAGVNWTW